MPSWIAIWPLAVSTSADGMKNGESAVAASLHERPLLVDDRRDAADRRADEDAHARRVELLDARVVPRLLGGRDGEQDVAVHPPRLLRRHERRGVESAHLGRDPHRVAARVEGLDEADAAPARDRGLPARRSVEPDRRHGPEARDGNAAHRGKSVVG